MAYNKVDNRTFVDMWMIAVKQRQSQKWVAGKLGITPSSVSSKVQYLRASGVRLPRLPYHPDSLTPAMVDELNELIKSQN